MCVATWRYRGIVVSISSTSAGVAYTSLSRGISTISCSLVQWSTIFDRCHASACFYNAKFTLPLLGLTNLEISSRRISFDIREMKKNEELRWPDPCEKSTKRKSRRTIAAHGRACLRSTHRISWSEVRIEYSLNVEYLNYQIDSVRFETIGTVTLKCVIRILNVTLKTSVLSSLLFSFFCLI